MSAPAPDKGFIRNYEQMCDYCGKFRKNNYVYNYYFETIDGYDYFSSTECVPCHIKSVLRGWLAKRNKKRKKAKEKKEIAKMIEKYKKERHIYD